MNCPYCNEELKPIVGACEDLEYYCQNCDCMTGDEKLWQKINTDKIAYQTAMDTLVEMTEELSKTKQALDVAVEVVKEIDELLSSNKFDVRELPLLNITQTKISMLLRCINLEQITALEQKDVK